MARRSTEVVCGNVIRDQAGRVCLVRESKPEALGRWSLPAGKAEVGESLREAAAREALEETGLVVNVGRLIGIYHGAQTLEGGSAVSFIFESAVIGGAIVTSAEHPDVAFHDQQSVDAITVARMLRGRHVALALQALEAGAYLDDDVVIEVPPSEPPRVDTPADEVR